MRVRSCDVLKGLSLTQLNKENRFHFIDACSRLLLLRGDAAAPLPRTSAQPDQVFSMGEGTEVSPFAILLEMIHSWLVQMRTVWGPNVSPWVLLDDLSMPFNWEGTNFREVYAFMQKLRQMVTEEVDIRGDALKLMSSSSSMAH